MSGTGQHAQTDKPHTLSSPSGRLAVLFVLIGYWRESREEGEHAPTAYVRELMGYGVLPQNIYHDVNVSGSKRDRPGLNTVRGLIERSKGEITALVIPDLSRLARDIGVWSDFVKLLNRKKVDLVDLSAGKQALDLDSASGRMSSNVKAIFAQFYLDECKERSNRTQRELREKGITTTAPFGYRVEKKTGKLVPDERLYLNTKQTRWEIAQALINHFLETKNASEVCRWGVENFGYAKGCRKMHPRSAKGLKDWLLNPVLQGHTAYFAWMKPCHLKSNPKEPQLIKDTHKALVSPDQAHRLKQVLDRPYVARGKAHQLATLIRCEACSQPMRRTVSKKKLANGGVSVHEYLKCSGAYPRSYKPEDERCKHSTIYAYGELEQQVIEKLTTRAHDIARGVTEAASGESEEIERLLVEIAQLQALEGIRGTDTLINEKARAIASLRASIEPESDTELLSEYQAAASDPVFWELATADERGTLYRALLAGVTVSLSGEVSVRFCAW